MQSTQCFVAHMNRAVLVDNTSAAASILYCRVQSQNNISTVYSSRRSPSVRTMARDATSYSRGQTQTKRGGALPKSFCCLSCLYTLGDLVGQLFGSNFSSYCLLGCFKTFMTLVSKALKATTAAT